MIAVKIIFVLAIVAVYVVGFYHHFFNSKDTMQGLPQAKRTKSANTLRNNLKSLSMYTDPENGFAPDETDKGECLVCKYEDDLDNFKTFAGRTVCNTCIKWAIEDGESITEMVAQEVEYRQKLKALATLEFSKLIKSII